MGINSNAVAGLVQELRFVQAESGDLVIIQFLTVFHVIAVTSVLSMKPAIPPALAKAALLLRPA